MTSESAPKNVSSIPSNCTHTILSFHLPSSIPIPNGIYSVRMGNKTADINIQRMQKSFGRMQFDEKVFTSSGMTSVDGHQIALFRSRFLNWSLPQKLKGDPGSQRIFN